jgi:transcriptional regulator with XRE-family HTH domain
MREKKEIAIKLGKRLKEFRNKHGYSQEAMASLLEMEGGGKTYSTYETGYTLPPLEKLLRICEIFDTSPNILLGYEDTSRINAICERYGIKYKTVKANTVEITIPGFKGQKTVSKIDFERILFAVQNNIYSEEIKESESKAFQAFLHLRLSMLSADTKDWFQSIFESSGEFVNKQDIIEREVDIEEKRKQLRKKRFLKGGK